MDPLKTDRERSRPSFEMAAVDIVKADCIYFNAFRRPLKQCSRCRHRTDLPLGSRHRHDWAPCARSHFSRDEGLPLLVNSNQNRYNVIQYAKYMEAVNS